MGELSLPRIVCAAVRYEDGTIIAGARHFDSVMRPFVNDMLHAGKPVQGFIDQHGDFYGRKASWVIAERGGQIIRRVGGDGIEGHGLFSENLY